MGKRASPRALRPSKLIYKQTRARRTYTRRFDFIIFSSTPTLPTVTVGAKAFRRCYRLSQSYADSVEWKHYKFLFIYFFFNPIMWDGRTSSSSLRCCRSSPGGANDNVAARDRATHTRIYSARAYTLNTHKLERVLGFVFGRNKK